MNELSTIQLRRFAEDGFLVLSGIVDERFLSAADAEIDALISAAPPPQGTVGKHFYTPPPEDLPAARAALFDSGAINIAEQLTAPESLSLTLNHIQVALNIPPYSHRPGGPHIDGFVKQHPHQRRPDSFTLLGGIYLGDESTGDAGNLWVWPGSHRLHARLLRERGTQALMATSGHIGLLEDPPVLPEQKPVLAKRGDLLLAHYLLGHNTGGNTSEQTRRILYFRLGTATHRRCWEQALRDPLLEFPAVKRALAT